MKKVLSIGMVLVMLLSLMTSVLVLDAGAAAWDGTSASSSLSGEGTSVSPYLIGSGADLKYLEEAVNGGNTFAGKYFRQIADIDLGGKEWIPIGYKSSLPFQGHYDGGDFTISNLYITTNHFGVGLFGFLGVTSGNLANECGIANLNVKGTITLTAAADFDSIIMVGGIVGQINYDQYLGTTQAYLKNVVSEINVSVTNMPRNVLIGGVCGHASGALFESVHNKGTVTVNANKTCYNPTGGLVGRSENSVYRACVNYGAVKFVTPAVDDQIRVGGMIGFYYKKAASQYLTLENCVNTASVWAESTNAEPYIILVGGILGGLSYTAPTFTWAATSGEWRDFDITFQSCANTGDITGKNTKSKGNVSVGGILGSTYIGAYSAANNGGGFTFSGCASSGTLTNPDEGRTGLIGCVYTDAKANYDILIENCSCSTVIAGVKAVKTWTSVCVNSTADSYSHANKRAQAILSTATGDNDTVVNVVVALISIVAIFGVATKVVMTKKAR